MRDRQTLWNTIDSMEKRCDAQLAREIEVGVPLELNASEQVELLRDYVRREFVSQGMIADLSIHRDNPHNPHAHILLTTRQVCETGFGLKQRGWNSKHQLLAWRQGWAVTTNQHLAQAGLAIQIDHRTLQAQGLALTPGRKIGISAKEQSNPRLTGHLADRIAEQRGIANLNGETIMAQPAIALQALSYHRATFTHRDIAQFLHTRTHGGEQFQAAYLKVTTSDELLPLGTDEQGQLRFTTRETLQTERDLLGSAKQLAARTGHAVDEHSKQAVLTQHQLSEDQHTAQRQATQALAAGHMPEALNEYDRHGALVAVETGELARSALLARWAKDRKTLPNTSRLMLAYTQQDVQRLNDDARTLLQQQGALQKSERILTARGSREFAPGDRLLFLRNEKSVGVKNGTLGTLEALGDGVLQVRLDRDDATRVAIDTRFYQDTDHGYATTVHKAQGTTVDRAYVLATPHYDRHTAYVALSRHREAVTMFYARDDFGGRGGQVAAEEVQRRFWATLSRFRPNEFVLDYLSARPETPAAMISSTLRERFLAGLTRAEQAAAQRLEEQRIQSRLDASAHWQREHARQTELESPTPQQAGLHPDHDHGL